MRQHKTRRDVLVTTGGLLAAFAGCTDNDESQQEAVEEEETEEVGEDEDTDEADENDSEEPEERTTIEVLDENGEPVEGASVESSQFEDGQTDQNGEYHPDSDAEDLYSFHVTAEGYGRETTLGEPGETRTVQLRPIHTVTVNIDIPDDTAGPRNMEIFLSGEDTQEHEIVSDGAEFGVKEGEYATTALFSEGADQYYVEEEPATIQVEGDTEVTYSLGIETRQDPITTIQVFGEDYHPVEEATVTIGEGIQERTNANGKVQTDDLDRAQSYNGTVTADGHDSVDFEVLGGETQMVFLD